MGFPSRNYRRKEAPLHHQLASRRRLLEKDCEFLRTLPRAIAEILATNPENPKQFWKKNLNAKHWVSNLYQGLGNYLGKVLAKSLKVAKRKIMKDANVFRGKYWHVSITDEIQITELYNNICIHIYIYIYIYVYIYI